MSVGGEALETNDIQAGRVKVGSEENRIDNNAGEYVDFNSPVTFDGQDDFENPTDIQGTIVSQMMYFRDAFDDSMQ